MAIIDVVRWESNSHEIVHKFPLEYILVLFVPKKWKDNAALMTLILLLASQIILYVIAYFVSKIS